AIGTHLEQSSILAIAARPISVFYNQPIVEFVVYASIIGFFISGLSLQHRAVISRDLRFGSIALIDSVSQLIGFITTLTLAFIRHDVWAIVIGGTVQAVVGSLLVVLVSRWQPDRYPASRNPPRRGGPDLTRNADPDRCRRIRHFR
ncbi:MAG: hypothetical protein EOP20_14650, partial [Hyphomicrobiales bacterium]